VEIDILFSLLSADFKSMAADSQFPALLICRAGVALAI